MTSRKQAIGTLHGVMTRCVSICLLVSLSASLCPGDQESTSRSSRRTRRSEPIKIIQLPQPKTSSSLSFEQLLTRLNSTVSPSANPLMVEEIGQLAWAGQGVTFSTNTPSESGNLLPNIQLLFATYDGIYQYDPRAHSLKQETTTDVRTRLALSALGPQATLSGCVVLITSNGQRLASRRARTERQMLNLKVGQLTQTIRLQAASLNLVSVTANTLDLNTIRRICSLSRNVEPYHMLFVGYRPGQESDESQTDNAAVTPTSARAKRAVMIVPPRGYREEELVDTAKALNAAGIVTVIASTQAGTLQGMLGTTVQTDVLLNELEVDNYDALVFVGGTGAGDYVNNPLVNAVAGEALRKDKIVGASSMAPMILAGAGLLQGTRVTGFAGDRRKLVTAGAIYTGSAVERHNRVITAMGPSHATLFGKAIAEAIYMQ